MGNILSLYGPLLFRQNNIRTIYGLAKYGLRWFRVRAEKQLVSVQRGICFRKLL
jgi:hypothetical protein